LAAILTDAQTNEGLKLNNIEMDEEVNLDPESNEQKEEVTESISEPSSTIDVGFLMGLLKKR